VEVISGPPDPHLDEDINLFRIPCLDLYNPDDLFRVPSFKELSDPVNLIEWLGVSTMGFPEPFTFGIRANRFLRNKIRKYDIVHDNQSLSYGIRSINKYIPTIATIHHPITVDRDLAVKAASSFWKKIKQIRWYSFISMQKRISRTLSHIITVSKSARDDISRDFKIPLQRFRIIPNGINTDLFCPVPEIKRKRDRIIVTNSADTPLKGLDYLLKAIAEISRTRSNIRLIVVGTPKKNGGIEKLIRKLGIGEFVTFTGRISNDEFVRQYAKAFLAVVPSVYEGFGLPAGEAMACGLPVVSTTGGALSEVVGDAGILVPPADSRALAGAVTAILDNPEVAEKMGRAGYERVHKLFTWKRAAEMTVEAYRETISDYSRF
jgi:glycosyltransferase involved in cell wall biosynthesis